MDRKLYVKKPKFSIRNYDKTEKVKLGKMTMFMDIETAKKYGKITKRVVEDENKREDFVSKLRIDADSDNKQNINKEYIEKHKKVERKTEKADMEENER